MTGLRSLALFDPVWESLAPREQARVIRLLIQRVDYDGEKGTVSVNFPTAGGDNTRKPDSKVTRIEGITTFGILGFGGERVSDDEQAALAQIRSALGV